MLNGFPAVYPYQQRVEDVVLWLSDARYDVNFATLYFPEPDEQAHGFGVGSKEMRQALLKLDAAIGALLDALEEKDLLDDVNIILAKIMA